MKKIILLYIIIGCGFQLSAQEKVRDSLLKSLQSAKKDTTAIIMMIQVGQTYENNEPPVARTWYRKALALSREIHSTEFEIKSLGSILGPFLVEGNLDSAGYFAEQTLALARKANDSFQIGLALFNIGTINRDQGEYETALKYYLEGRAIFEAKSNKYIEMQMNDALSVLYTNRSEWDKAIQYGEKAVQQCRELKYKGFLAQTLINISLAYAGKKDFSRAEVVVLEAKKLGEETNDIRIQANAALNLGGIFLEKGDMAGLKTLSQKSLVLFRQIGSSDGEAIALRALAVCYLQEKNFAKGKEMAEMALALNRKDGHMREEAAVLRTLSTLNYAAGDVVNGLKLDNEYNAILEKMVKDILSQQTANLEKKYETAKKENTIKQLQAERALQKLSIRQKNTLNYILIGSAVAILIVALLSYRTYKQKQRIQQQRISELETEKQLTATEAVLKGEEQERTRLAKDLHDGLGGMLSGIKYSLNSMKGNLIMTPDNAQAFERSIDMLDSSIKEMRRVAHNMMPETLVKFGLDVALNDFCNEITQSGALKITYQSIGLTDAPIEQTTAITIYRIVQELVNNSIKHAAAKSVLVQVAKTNNSLTITVEDDGKGFDTAILQASKGIGWSNIQNRVEFLKGKLDVQSSPGKGTSVLIELKS